jgi:hypothetical protein
MPGLLKRQVGACPDPGEVLGGQVARASRTIQGDEGEEGRFGGQLKTRQVGLQRHRAADDHFSPAASAPLADPPSFANCSFLLMAS